MCVCVCERSEKERTSFYTFIYVQNNKKNIQFIYVIFHKFQIKINKIN